MGLTVSRKTVKNLAVERLYWKMLTVSRKKVNGLKNFPPLIINLPKFWPLVVKAMTPLRCTFKPYLPLRIFTIFFYQFSRIWLEVARKLRLRLPLHSSVGISGRGLYNNRTRRSKSGAKITGWSICNLALLCHIIASCCYSWDYYMVSGEKCSLVIT